MSVQHIYRKMGYAGVDQFSLFVVSKNKKKFKVKIFIFTNKNIFLYIAWACFCNDYYFYQPGCHHPVI